MFALRRKSNPRHWVRCNRSDPPEINEWNTWYTANFENRAEFPTREEAEAAAREVGRPTTWAERLEVVEL